MTAGSIIDTPFNVAGKAAALYAAGIRTVIRYYNFRNSRLFSSKCLTAPEAQTLCAAGMKLATVFQQRQNQPSDFSHDVGLRAGRRAHQLAADAIGQPDGSAIYFAVDFDASTEDIRERVLPYFEGVREGLAAAVAGAPQYRIGAYGSGLVCDTLGRAGLSELTWLSMSRAFRGTQQMLKSGEWHLSQLAPAGTLLGFGVDYDESNAGQADFGGFVVEEEEAHVALRRCRQLGDPAAHTMRVTARSGLRLRAGPGTGFDIIAVLPLGTQVHVRGLNDGWARIDREGDGSVDGFVFAALLE